MKISGFRVRTVAIPVEAPTRHSYASVSAYTRTILELSSDEGLVGLGETDPAVSRAAFEGLRPVLLGADPFNLESIRIQISEHGYFSRRPRLAAAVEMACYDLQGKSVSMPVYQLLGGQVRKHVPMAAYLFYRYAGESGAGEITSPEQVVAHAERLVSDHGFRTLKLKGGVFEPRQELAAVRALCERFGRECKLRFDPNAIWSPATAIRIGKQLEPLGLEYYEDPTWGLAGMTRVREKVDIPIATNMAVLEFEQLGPAVAMKAIDTILSDPWYWGGLYHTKVLGCVAKHFGLAVGMHSGVEMGVGLAAMLHVASTMPYLACAIDSHYHHLTDDILKGGKLAYRDGGMTPPEGPGLGIELDEDKMERYEKLHQGNTAPDYPPDPRRPDWYPIVPTW